MSKALYCEYCKRFCDERCLKCIYMKEAKLKEKEDKEDEKKMESKESEERQSSGSCGVTDITDSIRRLLSTTNLDELTTLKIYIDYEIIERGGLEAYIKNEFRTIYSSIKEEDPYKLYNIEEELLKYITEEGGK